MWGSFAKVLSIVKNWLFHRIARAANVRLISLTSNYGLSPYIAYSSNYHHISYWLQLGRNKVLRLLVVEQLAIRRHHFQHLWLPGDEFQKSHKRWKCLRCHRRTLSPDCHQTVNSDADRHFKMTIDTMRLLSKYCRKIITTVGTTQNGALYVIIRAQIYVLRTHSTLIHFLAHRDEHLWHCQSKLDTPTNTGCLAERTWLAWAAREPLLSCCAFSWGGVTQQCWLGECRCHKTRVP